VTTKYSGTRGRILGRNWEKSLKSFSPCYSNSQSPQLTDFTPSPPPLSKSGLKLVCNVNIVYGNLNSENSQDYAQKPQRNCTFMNSASESVCNFRAFVVYSINNIRGVPRMFKMQQVKFELAAVFVSESSLL
jgi:hypothetical protein